mmetsp:Transcript_634/g.2253  ORF Transcript_634/g.2253 Transcript_634/m.2253 type:complete len:85 (-) Transcript_634:25-279(-)
MGQANQKLSSAEGAPHAPDRLSDLSPASSALAPASALGSAQAPDAAAHRRRAVSEPLAQPRSVRSFSNEFWEAAGDKDNVRYFS